MAGHNESVPAHHCKSVAPPRKRWLVNSHLFGAFNGHVYFVLVAMFKLPKPNG